MVTGIAILILVAGVSLISMEYKNKKLSRIYYAERMDPNKTEPGLTPADLIINPNLPQSKVEMGIYVDRIVELSMKNTNWIVDFYVWFRWKDSAMLIGDNFQVVDGSIETKEKKNEYHHNNDHYVLYRVVARITSVFEEFRFPCDDHLLTICIEDPTFDRGKMI